MELPVRPVEKRTVGEHLSLRKAEAQKQHTNLKRGLTTATVTGVPPISQVRANQ